MLNNKTALITGGSRGIGKAIAMRLAQAGANIAIVGKTTEAHPKLDGTIYSAAEDIEAASGRKVLALPGDIRHEDMIQNIVSNTISTFGGIDILVNNASAINLSNSENIEPKRFDLMHQINVRGAYLMSVACLPYLKKSANAHILNLSPPLNMKPSWFGKHVAYTMSKYGMSMVVLGLAEELRPHNIAVNALWPQTTIATAAVQNLLGGAVIMAKSRKPAIVAEAAYYIFQKEASSCTGNFFIDEDVLKKEAGITDFTVYAVDPSQVLMKDLFVE
jgi:citronellol/citronellal dehydrogenase